MARRTRTDFPGAVHHVFGRGNSKKDIFLTDAQKRAFIKRLILVCKEEGLILYAYCIMSNHFHLLIETGPNPLAHGMQRLLTGFSGWHNYTTDSVGHVFQGRYGAKLCSDDVYFQWLLWYIHNNPVEAKIVQRAEQWPWSSHCDYLAGRSSIVAVERPLSLFGSEAARMAAYREFVAQPAASDPSATPLTGAALRVFLKTGIDVEGLGSEKGREAVAAKRLFIQAALELGFKQKEIAEFLACSPAAVSLLISRM